MIPNPELDSFVESLAVKSGLTDPAAKAVALGEIRGHLEEFIFLKLAEALPGKDRQNFLEMLEAFPNSFDPYAELQAKIPDMNQRIQALLPEFEAIYFRST